MITLNKRPITNIQVEGIDLQDYPDFVDSFIGSAQYEDTGDDLSDFDIYDLQDKYPSLAQELIHEDQLYL
tara:strand:- start:244 stop:453 length:210 start_codon:yes stop_codon:yes gene_type:complete